MIRFIKKHANGEDIQNMLEKILLIRGSKYPG
jgi:hypothetical protein